MLRALVTTGFLLVAVLVLWAAFLVGTETSWGNLYINLGTEIVGIVMTVAVVEWFFERRRLQNRGKQLAWDALHNVQNAVWVWQGGPREMETDDMLGILKAASDDDPLPDILEEATVELARALGQPAERHLASLIRFRDPSVASQEHRHFGGRGADRWASEREGT